MDLHHRFCLGWQRPAVRRTRLGRGDGIRYPQADERVRLCLELHPGVPIIPKNALCVKIRVLIIPSLGSKQHLGPRVVCRSPRTQRGGGLDRLFAVQMNTPPPVAIPIGPSLWTYNSSVIARCNLLLWWWLVNPYVHYALISPGPDWSDVL